MNIKTRKRHNSAFKTKVALAAIREDKTIAELAAEFKIHTTQISEWKKSAKDYLLHAFDATASNRNGRGSNGRRNGNGHNVKESDLYEEIGRLKVENAFAEKVVIDKKRDLVSYRVNYKNLDRKIQINFINRFPYEIVEWSEEYKSGFGTNPKLLKTKGVKSKTLIIDYWNKNDIEDEDLRKVLGI